MGYTIEDAWSDEKVLGDWPFERWSIGNLELRPEYRYFQSPRGTEGVAWFHDRLWFLFIRSQKGDLAHLRSALHQVKQTVACAIEHSDADAYESWLHKEVWSPVLNDTVSGDSSPAEMLIQSLDYVGPGDEYAEEELLSALGLWLIGELASADSPNDKAVLLEQLGMAAAEAMYYQGLHAGQKEESKKVTERAKTATDARHAANRTRLLKAEKWWRESASGKMSQAQAAREIAQRFAVVEAVATRWIRQFKRKNE